MVFCYQIIGTKTGMEQMIGNAVPVNLAKFVGDSIMAYLGIDIPVNIGDIQKEYPSEIVNHKAEMIDSKLDVTKNVLVSLVKNGSNGHFVG